MKHLDQKYFSYREKKMNAALSRYSDRAGVLIASEYMRLGFVAFGAALCAVIFGILAVTAGPRIGWFEWRTITFALLTVMPALIVVRVALSFLHAFRLNAAHNPRIT